MKFGGKSRRAAEFLKFLAVSVGCVATATTLPCTLLLKCFSIAIMNRNMIYCINFMQGWPIIFFVN